ncbi:hypothetical protein B484DRAFT_448881 [Ochromonadaceae sp. CCMP2298]|nr:hypothetical protein B484DRAFT_448881 [Ochromonadaceae sp. CCMP2298]
MSSFLGVLDHEEAEKCEVLQLAASGCGVTALVNVLVALKVIGAQRPEKESIEVGSLDWSGCILRTRANDAPLPQYLASRAVAGCTGQDLVTSMQLLVQNNTALQGHQLYGKFYSHGEIESMGLTVMGFVEMHLGQGHCPVATLNLQLVGNDAWHHQMIYGIDRHAGGLCNEVGYGSTVTTPPLEAEDALPTAREGVCVHCVNPVCAYPEYALNAFLSTKSALLVRAEDVLERYDLPGGDETIYDQPLWEQFQVREQICRLVEARGGGAVGAVGTSPCPDKETRDVHGEMNESGVQIPSHVVIPASYQGGLAIFSLTPL